MGKRWRLEYQGETYREAEVTIGYARRIEASTGLSWLSLNPVESASSAACVLAKLHSDRASRAYDEVLAEIEALTPAEFIHDVWFLDDDDLPTEFTDGNPPAADAP